MLGLSTNVYALVNRAEQPLPLQYCIDPNWMPYEAIRNGVHVGISSDYLRVLQDLGHFDFELLPTTSWQETLDLAARGDCDFIALLNRSPERDRTLLFSDSFFTSPNVLVGPTGTSVIQGYEAINDKTIAVVKGYRHEEYLDRYYPLIPLLRVNSESEALRAVAEGNADIAVGSLLAVNALIQTNGYKHIQVIGLAQPHDQLRIGVSKRLQSTQLSAEQLVERFNIAIQAIPELAHVDIYRQWNNVKYIEHTNYKVFVWPLAVLIIVIVMVIWRNRTIASYNQSLQSTNNELQRLQQELVEKNRTLEFLSIHDHLTGLYNRNFILQRAEEAVNAFNRFKQPVSLIIMDIDHFKRINDQYGHSMGDHVLCQVAKVGHRVLREVDLFSRWGGEEFLILCPGSDEREALVLAERLRSEIEALSLRNISQTLTCSFGVAQLTPDTDFPEWFDNADKCLFRAKSAGRNAIVSHQDSV